ncbi:uncharacterized protein MICPUCDRAFT_10373, partial [Micromonas pusilla CCMP1545]
LARLVNNVLDFSKIEAGKMELEETPFSLRSLVKETSEIMRAQATRKGLALNVRVADDVPEVIRSDALKLKQILVNLISNSVKFTRVGSVALTVTVASDADATEEYLRFEVEDTGVGMTRDVLTRIFEPFEQANRSTNRTFGGTGLGLALSKSLVELYGGILCASSNAGRGSVFSFAVGTGGGLKNRDDLRGAGPISVLIAEDNALNRKILSSQLKCLGDFNVRHVVNGAEAVDVISSSEHDAYAFVIMDYQMPVMDGIEATRRIRQLEQDTGKPPVAIVGYTASVEQSVLRRAEEVGMDMVLSKPCSIPKLRALIKMILMAHDLAA